MKLNELLMNSANKYVEFQKEDGSFLSGHNGPYRDSETPVRNTAHMLFLFSNLYNVSKSQVYKNVANKALDYLMSEAARPTKHTFYHREKKGKDKCNGLVGQAWCIEALVAASEALGRSDSYKLAEEVYLLHRFDSEIGIWNRMDVDGSQLGFDATFNHQLWFSASASMLKKTPEAQSDVGIFLDKVAVNVSTYPNNVIYHSSPMGRVISYSKFGLKPLLSEVKSRIGKSLPSRKAGMYSKSVGYHGFNMYAFAMLKEQLPEHGIWNLDLMGRLLEPCKSDEFRHDLRHSVFGYFYNVSGIELAYAYEVLLGDKHESTQWLQLQLDNTWLNAVDPLSANVIDINTARSRLYAAVRLRNDYVLNAPNPI